MYILRQTFIVKMAYHFYDKNKLYIWLPLLWEDMFYLVNWLINFMSRHVLFFISDVSLPGVTSFCTADLSLLWMISFCITDLLLPGVTSFCIADLSRLGVTSFCSANWINLSLLGVTLCYATSFRYSIFYCWLLVEEYYCQVNTMEKFINYLPWL
jgi:hypothetical protein